ncbi:MAG: ABC transporter ATP-binding protein [Oleibacter sp.]|nr:ABC transporter ATP-binding protein [Thalassolituus sp.]
MIDKTVQDSSLSSSQLTKTVLSGDQPLTILKAVDLDIKAGESVAIVGASGSGKSTLLGLLAGLDVASDGQVTLLGHDLSAKDEDARAAVRAQGVAFVFQNFHLLPGLTALENVMLPLEIRGQMANRDIKAEANRLLTGVGLGQRITHYPNQLSGGEQQRVALARAFAGQPKVLFADEPTGNLDSTTGAHIETLLFELNEKSNTTLVLVTHDETLAARCQRQFRMADGVLAEVSI